MSEPVLESPVESRELAVRSGEVDLAAREDGPPDGRAVVLLHGVTATRNHVLMRSTRLERHGFRVVRYDARGHGRSTAPARPDAYGYDAMLDDLRVVLDALSIERALFVGTSMGSHVALRLALESPERVAAIAAVTPAYDSDAHPDEEAVARGDRLARALRRGGREAFVDAFEMPAASPTRTAAFRQALLHQLAEHRDLLAVADALEHVMRARPFGDFSELRAIGVPALVVGSRDQFDRQHRFAVAEKYAAALPDASFATEADGRMPLAWNGGALSKLILELTKTAAW